MKVKLLQLHENGKVPFQKYDSDYAYDVYATSAQEIEPNVWKYGLGIALQIERENVPVTLGDCEIGVDMKQAPVKLGIRLSPRSSIYKTGMMLSNSVGTIDEEYTGEISAVFYHVIPALPKYEVGDRIGQITLEAALPMEFVTVDALDETDRKTGGFGSTGRK